LVKSGSFVWIGSKIIWRIYELSEKSDSVGRGSVECKIGEATGMRVRGCIVLRFKYVYSLQFEIDFGRQFISFRCEKVKQQDCVQCEPVKLLKKKIVEAFSSPNGLCNVSE
jgi:hypothetical protein